MIPGVTDREYYTNSFHVPVYFDIKAIDKINIEAPYHALTNAGHISYVELDEMCIRDRRCRVATSLMTNSPYFTATARICRSLY